MLVRLLYASRAVKPLLSDELTVIMRQSTTNNPLHGITGLLCLSDGVFMQALEGGRNAVNRLYLRIAADPRHTDLRIVERKSITKLSFSTWNMAYMGPSKFVARHVKQLVEHKTGSRSWRAADWIHDLMVEFERAA